MRDLTVARQHHPVQSERRSLHHGIRSDGYLATASQATQKRTFGQNACERARVIDFFQKDACTFVILTAFQSQSALTYGRQHPGSIENFRDMPAESQSFDAGLRRIKASMSESNNLRMRVSTLPRISTICKSGRRRSISAHRRMLLEATTAPRGKSPKDAYFLANKASPTGPRRHGSQDQVMDGESG